MPLQVYKEISLSLENIKIISRWLIFIKAARASFLINDKRCQRFNLDRHAIILFPVLSHSFKMKDTQSE